MIRGSLSEINNASKTPNPATTDERVFAVLNKQIKESRKAAQEFETEKRPDLSQQEMLRIGVLEEYLNTVERFDDEDISKAAREVITKFQSQGQEAKFGQIMSAVKKTLQGKTLEMENVSRIVRGMV